ncbi:MAG: hypothetical protein HC807_05385, partial [Gammaproteobacteria bacterium]|nr:hypothetical protein [Gammaproteobacteria bacterium]
MNRRLRITPARKITPSARAAQLQAQGQMAAAEQLLTGVLQQYPDHFQAHFAIGMLYYAGNYRAQAIQHVQRASQLEPGSFE